MEIMDWIFVIGVLLVINIGMTYIAMKDIKYLEKTVPHTQEINELSAKINYLERKLDDIDDSIGDVMMDVSSLKPLEDDDDLY